MRPPYHWLDHVYGSLMHRTRVAPQFFEGGWGGRQLAALEDLIQPLFDRGLERVSEESWPPPPISPSWRVVGETRAARLLEASLPTPCRPEIGKELPPESRTARVRWLTPKPAFVPGGADSLPPACVLHLAGTGDHGFGRRLRMGVGLLKENVSTMVLESPFYGRRRPRGQRGAKLRRVSELLLLGRSTIEEARALLHYAESRAGVARLGVCGLSMGGVHAAMVGALHPDPIAILPFLAPHSAAAAFCDGMLRHGTAWGALEGGLPAAAPAATCQLAGAGDAGAGAASWQLPGASATASLWEAAAAPDTSGGGGGGGGGPRDFCGARGLEGGHMGTAALARMRAVLALTDVTRFPVPKRAGAAIFVAARNDGYVSRESATEVHRTWPGSELRWIRGGHVSCFLFQDRAFQSAIRDALSRLSL